MRLLAAIQPPDATRAILERLDLPTRGPPRAPALPDGADGSQGDFDAAVWGQDTLAGSVPPGRHRDRFARLQGF